MKRGALIIIEGVDRTGKSTQARKLVENLKKKQIQAKYTNFPARETEVGKVINSYIQLKNDLSDEVVHLLFSANRWERAKEIIKTLEAGLDIEWCKSPDVGLPKPDKVFFLTMPFESIMERKGFGEERYEVLEFQKKVSDTYAKLREDYWEVLDANRSMESIEEDLLERTLDIVNDVSDKPIGSVWVKK
ncbi:unnamed protein product [Chrysodeixis includens]|uniref:Thymidylate kinase-like domain-containing protein n=1 Tax=Chrysodeixis includens TaxID=689277 RepID=A0A9N8KWE8_CHRIL|nr:unnamed protein product [Chrysodeixis includens]